MWRVAVSIFYEECSTLSSPNLPLLSSSTTIRELRSQFSIWQGSHHFMKTHFPDFPRLFPDELSKFHYAGIGQIHHSHQARDRKGGISTPKSHLSQSLIFSEYVIWLWKKQQPNVTTTFSFGRVNMIKFPDFYLIWHFLKFPDWKTWNSLSRVAGNPACCGWRWLEVCDEWIKYILLVLSSFMKMFVLGN